MSSAQQALRNLVTDADLRAIAITGPWGCGKTYLVREKMKLLEEGLKDAGLAFVYVSLFGVESIGELRRKTGAAALEARAGLLGKAISTVGKIPVTGDVVGLDIGGAQSLAAEFIQSRALKNFIVCFDDLERSGEGLRVQDVLGLISELIEQRSSKCILVLNRQKLGDRMDGLRSNEEKVLDLTITFDPPLDAVLEIGIADPTDRTLAAPIFRRMGCSNIRLARRLSWLLRKVRDTDAPGLTELWPQIVEHATTLVIIRYDHSAMFGSLQDLVESFPRPLFPADPDQVSTVSPGFRDHLIETDFVTHPYSSALAELLEIGALDSKRFAEGVAEAFHEQEHSKFNRRLRALDDILRDSFDPVSNKVLAEIRELFELDGEHSNPKDVARLCDILLGISADPDDRKRVLAALTPIFTPVELNSRANAARGYQRIIDSGVLQEIPQEAPQTKPTFEAAFASASSEFSANPMELEVLADEPVETWKRFLSTRSDARPVEKMKAIVDRVPTCPHPLRLKLKETLRRVLLAVRERDRVTAYIVDENFGKFLHPPRRKPDQLSPIGELAPEE